MLEDKIKSLLVKLDFQRPYMFRFADNSEFVNIPEKKPVFTAHFKTPNALKDTVRKGSVGFGEAYMNSQIDIEGSFTAFFDLGFQLQNLILREPAGTRIKMALDLFFDRNTLKGSQKNISHHYDLGNDFYELWLDKHMQYTCAYFEKENDSLKKAQEQKMDLVCRKLQLKPGETVVEAGGGWGGFARYAARKYKVNFITFNISKEQVAYARAKTEEQKLTDRVTFVHDDYRRIPEYVQQCDKFVSIGMLEHVGQRNYKNLFSIINKVLPEKGLGLVHAIGKKAPLKTDAWLDKYIFPGAYMPSLSEFVQPVERNDWHLHVTDVENLRFHYALTLDHWAKNFEKHVDKIREQYDENFVRMFRMYLRASEAGFLYGGIQLFQVLISKGYDNHEVALTRHHMLGY